MKISKDMQIALDTLDAKIRDAEERKRDLLEDYQERETLAEVRKRVLSKPKASKYLTGVRVIDDQMGGLTEGSFINIAGVNFSGKTTLVLNILKNIAEHKRAVFFSFEMYEDLLIHNKFADTKADDNLILIQKNNSLTEIESIIREEAKEGVKFFVIDSMMKIRVANDKEEYQKVSTISSTLARLTQELGIIVILINQIALTDIRNNHLSFKGSGDIAYDSDVSFFIMVDDDGKRLLKCTKDRVNEKTWEADITDRKYNIAPVEYRYKKTIDIPEL